jgi:hypothetical protein
MVGLVKIKGTRGKLEVRMWTVGDSATALRKDCSIFIIEVATVCENGCLGQQATRIEILNWRARMKGLFRNVRLGNRFCGMGVNGEVILACECCERLQLFTRCGIQCMWRDRKVKRVRKRIAKGKGGFVFDMATHLIHVHQAHLRSDAHILRGA